MSSKVESELGSVRVFPRSLTISADLLTPVSVFLRLSNGAQQAFLFESVEGGAQVSRYSYIGVNPIETLVIENGELKVRAKSGVVQEIKGNPFHEMGRYLNRYQSPRVEGLPLFTGGAVGYLGYESARYLERIAPRARTQSPFSSTESIPSLSGNNLSGTVASTESSRDAYLMIFRTVIVFDHVRNELIFISNHLKQEQISQEQDQIQTKKIHAEIEELRFQLSQPSSLEVPFHSKHENGSEFNPDLELELEMSLGSKMNPMESVLGKAKFISAVHKIKEYIRSGDIFQGVISERFSADLDVPPFFLYRALRSISPAPYLFYLQMEGETLVGASPEMLVRVTDRKAETSPIAGTRSRGKTELEDKKFELHLQKSPKEKAEHLMLVDLGRNDLGRISAPGSVQVTKFMQVEKFSHVMHLVSKVEGKLARGKTSWDALASCFPAGTLTGAPKIRAMQIISELEPMERGTYGGAVVFRDFMGNLDSCIVIRSIYCRDGKAYFQAGAGVVADSSPEREYDEVLKKTRSVRQAFALAKLQGISSKKTENQTKSLIEHHTKNQIVNHKENRKETREKTHNENREEEHL